jgi:hypothetical protein
MTVFMLQATILAMRNDDTESLVKILIVVIFFAFSIISNVIKSRSKKISHQQGGPASSNRARERSQDRPSSVAKPSMPDQEPAGRQIAQNTSLGRTTPAAKSQRPVKLQEITLRPGLIDRFKKGPSRMNTPGGLGEVSSEKSRLDRFLEAKLEPRKQHRAPEEPLKRRASEIPGETRTFEDVDRAETSITAVDEQIEEARSLRLDSENLADAIVYAEILGKPLALRDM